MKPRLLAHVMMRAMHDAMSSDKFAHRRDAMDMPHFIEQSQPFTASATLEKKKHNLQLAADRIEQVIIMPGETFSFWRIVGNPNRDEFEASRSIVGGVLKLERGGGLCQISGITYHLALMAGLEIVERYNHSVDLYTEETRFCPLGSDATVCYGYRDLRFRNNTASPIAFRYEVADTQFIARLMSVDELPQHEITFTRTTLENGHLQAISFDKTAGRQIAVSEYEVLEH